MNLWFLSFCDPDRPKGTQWLGTCFVEAATLEAAIFSSHLHGCNPGGEVLAAGVPIEELPDELVAAPRLTLFTTRESIPGGATSPNEWMGG